MYIYFHFSPRKLGVPFLSLFIYFIYFFKFLLLVFIEIVFSSHSLSWLSCMSYLFSIPIQKAPHSYMVFFLKLSCLVKVLHLISSLIPSVSGVLLFFLFLLLIHKITSLPHPLSALTILPYISWFIRQESYNLRRDIIRCVISYLSVVSEMARQSKPCGAQCLSNAVPSSIYRTQPLVNYLHFTDTESSLSLIFNIPVLYF